MVGYSSLLERKNEQIGSFRGRNLNKTIPSQCWGLAKEDYREYPGVRTIGSGFNVLMNLIFDLLMTHELTVVDKTYLFIE